MSIKVLATEEFADPPISDSVSGGVTNTDDPSGFPEDLIDLPWTVNPVTSWLDYRCWVEHSLDAGMVLHKALPQTTNVPIDTLSSVFIDDPDLDSANPSLGGVNLASASQAVDVIQRMATSTYRAVLRGWGLRAGYQVPIPGLESIGGITAVPERVQTAYNVIIDNLVGGIPLWLGVWEIHYILARSPRKGMKGPIPPNLAAHITADVKLPTVVLLPRTQTDQNATQASAPDLGSGFIQR